MAHETVLKVKKASFSAGNRPIKANKYGRAQPGDAYMPGGYIVGNEGIDAVLTVQPGWVIKTEVYVDEQGYQALRVYTEKMVDLLSV
jgi:hypothetical protein